MSVPAQIAPSGTVRCLRGAAAWLVICAAFGPATGLAAPGWSPAGCGREPQAPAVAGGSVARYNASIDQVAAYETAARSYSVCVTRGALAAQTAISEDAKARMTAIAGVAGSVQRRIGGNFTILSAQLKTAGERLGAARRR